MTFFIKGVSCFIGFLFLYIAEEIKDFLLGFKACHNHLIPHSSGKGRRKTSNHQNTVAIGVLNILRGMCIVQAVSSSDEAGGILAHLLVMDRVMNDHVCPQLIDGYRPP